MIDATREEQVQRLLDRAEICDVIGAYCYGMDSRDWDLYRSCWVDEIALDFSELHEVSEPKMATDDWVRMLQAFFREMTQSQHVKFPIRYEFGEGGDSCTVLAIMQGKHFMPTTTGGPTQTVVGYYRDDFVRTDEGWKLRGLKELVHWNEGNSFVLEDNLTRLYEVWRSL